MDLSPTAPRINSSPTGITNGHHSHDHMMNGTLSYIDMFEPSPSNVLLWKCKACSKEVTNRWHHFHSHTPQRSFCPYCPATYSRIDTLRSHMRSKHTMYFNKQSI